MKIIIFGTGNYCQKYLNYIDGESIVCFIDNDKIKWNKEFHGKQIYSDQHILHEKYDYIIVLVQNYYPIVEQLRELKIPENKILRYSDLYDIESEVQKLNLKDKETNLVQWTRNKSGMKIFICSHDFSRTGVPVALMNLAILLKRMGYQVLMAALGHGTLEEELRGNEVDFLFDMEGIYSSKRFLEEVKTFDVIILGTIAVAEVGKILSNLNIPIIWWIHESDDFYFKEYKLPIKRGNIFYYGGGKRVLRKFFEYYPNETMEELLYYLPDIQSAQHRHSEMKVFGMIGTFCERKAQDILISAITELPSDIREKCIFYFVGPACEEDKRVMEDLCQKTEQILYIYEMSQDELAIFYQQLDILICPSRDDPMPIVVTQALQNGIPCIVSDQVGQCEYIKKIGGGVVFPSGDAGALKQKIVEFVVSSEMEFEEYSKRARDVFESYFSEELMRQNISKIFNRLSLN